MTSVTNNSISLAWVPPDVNVTTAESMSNYTDFVIQYGKVNNMTMYETVVRLEHVGILYLEFLIIFGMWFKGFCCGVKLKQKFKPNP